MGHVGVVERTITFGRRAVDVAGVQSLAVARELRGTGLSGALMRESIAEAGRRGLSMGMLFCVPGLERFYSRLGWRRLHANVTMRDEHGRSVPLPAKNITMVLSLTGQALRPGDIDLCGPDW